MAPDMEMNENPLVVGGVGADLGVQSKKSWMSVLKEMLNCE